MKPKLIIAAACLFMAGCAELKEETVEVRCVAVHVYGESPAKGTMSERFTYMTAERIDTGERRNFVQVYGKPGDTFKMNWNERHYK